MTESSHLSAGAAASTMTIRGGVPCLRHERISAASPTHSCRRGTAVAFGAIMDGMLARDAAVTTGSKA